MTWPTTFSFGRKPQTWESKERLLIDARDAVDAYEADHEIEVDGPTRKKKQKKSRH